MGDGATAQKMDCPSPISSVRARFDIWSTDSAHAREQDRFTARIAARKALRASSGSVISRGAFCLTSPSYRDRESRRRFFDPLRCRPFRLHSRPRLPGPADVLLWSSDDRANANLRCGQIFVRTTTMTMQAKTSQKWVEALDRAGGTTNRNTAGQILVNGAGMAIRQRLVGRDRETRRRLTMHWPSSTSENIQREPPEKRVNTETGLQGCHLMSHQALVTHPRVPFILFAAYAICVAANAS